MAKIPKSARNGAWILALGVFLIGFAWFTRELPRGIDPAEPGPPEANPFEAESPDVCHVGGIQLTYQPFPAELLEIPAPQAPAPSLRFEIESRHRVLKVDQAPQVEIRLRNVGDQPATLMRPGPGSFAGLRSPILAWSIRGPDEPHGSHSYERPADGFSHCGILPPLSPEDFLTLSPQGGEVSLLVSTGGLVLRDPGVYRVVLYYHNPSREPFANWRMISGPFEPEPWRQLASTPEVFLESNELVFEVLP